MPQLARTTFASGEISPLVSPRDDLARQQAGLKRCENFVVLLEGGITRRPGTALVTELKTESEKGIGIPFQYDDSDAYSLIFNGSAIRFLLNGGVVLSGGVPYEVASPYAAADLPNLRFAQSGNVMFLTCAGYAPRTLTRSGATSWALALYETSDGPYDAQNLATADTIQASAVTGAAITLTRTTGLFSADDIGTLWRLDEPNFALVSQWKGNEGSLSDGDERRNNGRVYAATVTGGDNGADSGPNPPTHDEGAFSAGKGNPTWTYLHSGYGVVRISAIGGGGATATAEVVKRLPASVVSQATYRWSAPAWSAARGWPEECCLHKGSLLFTREDKWWLTAPNDFYDMNITFEDSTALAGRLLSQDGKRVAIRWARSTGLLVLGTSSAEWSIRGASALSGLTAETNGVNAIPESGEGSAVHRPALVENGAFFIGKSRKAVFFARFEPLAEQVDTKEISIASRHVLKGLVENLTFQKDPNRVLWQQKADGTLAGCTFMSTEEVNGWHRHPLTNGEVEHVWTVTSADGVTDETYLIVKRTIDGATRRFVELLQPFFEPEDADDPTAAGAWFLDCALAYEGAPVATLSGLDHLEGETVRLFVNGAQQEDQIVSDGAVTLSNPLPDSVATMTAIAGLKIVARATSLPVEPPPSSGVSFKGRMRQGVDAVLQIVDSAGGTLAINGGPAEPLFEYGQLAAAAPLPLSSAPLKPVNEVPSEMELTLDLVCDNCLPFTLTGWAPDLDISEEAA